MRRRVGRAGLCCLLALPLATAQEIKRPGPPPLEDFETDADQDGAPDGWYNLRDARLAPGGRVGPTCLRFDNELPGRPARASRAFGIDGRVTEAVIVGLWARLEAVLPGERLSDRPALFLELLDEDLRSVRRGVIGPWRSDDAAPGWARVAHRIPVPSSTRDAILTVGLLGATGRLEVDGLTIELIPRGGVETNNLVLNGGFELGEVEPDHWSVEGPVRRVPEGRDSDMALEFTRSGGRAQVGLSLPVSRFEDLEIRLAARGSGLRATGGARAGLFFLDESGHLLPGTLGSLPLTRWGGSFAWAERRVPVRVPPNAIRAVLQIEKSDAAGTLVIDDIEVVAAPNAARGHWSPDQEREATLGWAPYVPATAIEPGSALDFSGLLEAPAGSLGRVAVREGRLHHEKGERARFFGVSLMPPAAFLDAAHAEALADRLARCGVNLVRLSGLGAALPPGASLFDDSRDDTQAFDPNALSRLDHLIAALKAKGIFVALELQSSRRFREGDKVDAYRELPPGGGPAAAFDATIRARSMATAEALLTHVNPETRLALRDDPVLAWVALAGELSLFDQIDAPKSLPRSYREALDRAAESAGVGTGRRSWQGVESRQWAAEADALRKLGVTAPIAGSSHWRREPEFVAAQTASGLDLIDDRLYWFGPPWQLPDRASQLWDQAGSLAQLAGRKRRIDRPYAVGEWAAQTRGAWALPYEAADMLLMARAALVEDWDALVRRGVAVEPELWGAAASGTAGGRDVLVVPEVLNGAPHAFAMLPHAASIVLRGREGPAHLRRTTETAGRLAIETAHTTALAGWCQDRPLNAESVAIDIQGPFGAVAVTAVGREPLAKARRVLVTAVARAVPTGFAWSDSWRRTVADPGQPPILMEPVRATVIWKHAPGQVEAHALDPSGRRVKAVPVEVVREGVRLAIDSTGSWELVAP